MHYIKHPDIALLPHSYFVPFKFMSVFVLDSLFYLHFIQLIKSKQDTEIFQDEH
jgi:hypothetical protein